MKSPLPKLEEMTDILDIKGIEVWNWKYYWLALGVAAAVVLAFLFWKIWRRYFKKPRSSDRDLSPIERALRRLDELTQQGYLEGGRVRLFYFNLSEIFRDYLEEGIQIKANEATLEELKPLLKSISDFTQDEISEATWLLETSDMAKFARYVPPKEDIVKSVKVCRLLMESLARRREKPAGEEADPVSA